MTCTTTPVTSCRPIGSVTIASNGKDCLTANPQDRVFIRVEVLYYFNKYKSNRLRASFCTGISLGVAVVHGYNRGEQIELLCKRRMGAFI